ncbi:hypothetical protein MASR1M74_12950 [Lentimicrobium sp.]
MVIPEMVRGDQFTNRLKDHTFSLAPIPGHQRLVVTSAWISLPQTCKRQSVVISGTVNGDPFRLPKWINYLLDPIA